ncbi:hypothetical protein ACFV1F_22325 [Streptomyces sp. NPDC059590]|uniref:hypothetical protein n=1 Tax=unclassified Streptomyces TaxID=2593676 RepID=UPI0036CB7026
MTSTNWENHQHHWEDPRMLTPAWLNTKDRFVPGTELFRSDRAFTVWAYTISHSQLLLRTRTTMVDGSCSSRIDVVFKPVQAMKVRIEYDGLVIRCATEAEVERIKAENTGTDGDARCLILETEDDQDYVITHAVGWHEDMETDRNPSRLAGFAPGSDPNRILR